MLRGLVRRVGILPLMFFAWLLLGSTIMVTLMIVDAVAKLRGFDWSDRIFDYGWLPLIVVFLPVELVIIVLLLFYKPPIMSEGHCTKCGYDLRAHKPGDKCPECGKVIPRSS